MTIPKHHERAPDDTRAYDVEVSDTGAADSIDNPERVTAGAWLSLALSLSFYLLMLAIGAKYDSDRHPRAKPAEPDHSTLSGPMANAPVAASSQTLAPRFDAPGALLARARACAAVAQWNCVIEATSGVIARRGNTPETRALLTQAMVNGGWVPANAPTVASTVQTQDIHPVSVAPPGPKRMMKHVHRHVPHPPLLRYATTTRSDFPSYMPDIYRH
ncbi:hypothetical protein [Paraburkholderia dinghuensis]|uniref:Uncharacterized protein n=1 Tax=Paraburkholderia dinghuensis TaxID=2305225 RepID=A0A3N6MLA6_9BURK|nr:hypothetical protein [Paraburkholderia dinghuensis]RQH02215.1 hypothetical protein D1Y85_22305 [Paraburkholderia dinghuensis]